MAFEALTRKDSQFDRGSVIAYVDVTRNGETQRAPVYQHGVSPEATAEFIRLCIKPPADQIVIVHVDETPTAAQQQPAG